MNRRQFLGLSALTAAVATVPPASHHLPVPNYACHTKHKDSSRDHDMPQAALIGPCYVNTRGTYAGWDRPGVPPVPE